MDKIKCKTVQFINLRGSDYLEIFEEFYEWSNNNSNAIFINSQVMITGDSWHLIVSYYQLKGHRNEIIKKGWIR